MFANTRYNLIQQQLNEKRRRDREKLREFRTFPTDTTSTPLISASQYHFTITVVVCLFILFAMCAGVSWGSTFIDDKNTESKSLFYIVPGAVSGVLLLVIFVSWYKWKPLLMLHTTWLFIATACTFVFAYYFRDSPKTDMKKYAIYMSAAAGAFFFLIVFMMVRKKQEKN